GRHEALAAGKVDHLERLADASGDGAGRQQSMLAQRIGDVLAHRERVEERALLEEHGDVAPHRHERVLVEPLEDHAVHLDLAGIGHEERVHVLQEHALARAAPAEHDERLARQHVEREPAQHGLRAEGLLEAAAADVGRCAHERRKSLVRKKSEMRTVIEAATTVRVVARPTPSAPPVTWSPFRQAMMPMKYAKKNDLPMPEKTSRK